VASKLHGVTSSIIHAVLLIFPHNNEQSFLSSKTKTSPATFGKCLIGLAAV